MINDVVTIRQFNRDRIEDTFALAERYAISPRSDYRHTLRDANGVLTLFFSPSTRTYLTSRWATKLLGGELDDGTEAAAYFSSTVKGESLENTIQTVCQLPYLGLIFIRHPKAGSAQIAAEIASQYGIHVINCGDGNREHPTQGLLDLYTICRDRAGNIDGVNITFVNDLKDSRTVHSLSLGLALNGYTDKIGICAPDNVDLPQDFQTEIESCGVKIIRYGNLKEAAQASDYLYMTRPQLEFKGKLTAKQKRDIIDSYKPYIIDDRIGCFIAEETKCKVMHPLPVDCVNFNEICPMAQNLPNSLIWKEVRNGVYIRMALAKKALIS